MDLISRVKHTIAVNTEIKLIECGMTVKEIIESIDIAGLPSLSTMVFHCMRTGEKLPRVDKLYIIAEVLGLDAREFMEPRTSEFLNGFLSLNSIEKRSCLRILKDQGNFKKKH